MSVELCDSLLDVQNSLKWKYGKSEFFITVWLLSMFTCTLPVYNRKCDISVMLYIHSIVLGFCTDIPQVTCTQGTATTLLHLTLALICTHLSSYAPVWRHNICASLVGVCCPNGGWDTWCSPFWALTRSTPLCNEHGLWVADQPAGL